MPGLSSAQLQTVALLAPFAAVWLLARGLSALARWDPAVLRRLQGRRRRAGPAVPDAHPPLEALSADLARLAAELDRIDRTNPPAKVARLKATALAYDGVLLDACRTLEVPAPGSPPLLPAQRLEAELELARAGFDW